LIAAVCGALACGAIACGDRGNGNAPAANQQTAVRDNTGVNTRDRAENAKTPMAQGNDDRDLRMTQQIRQDLTADDSLSTNAKNVKIIANNGTVTLRGPVDSDGERARVAAKAEAVAPGKVTNQLEVASGGKS